MIRLPDSLRLYHCLLLTTPTDTLWAFFPGGRQLLSGGSRIIDRRSVEWGTGLSDHEVEEEDEKV